MQALHNFVKFDAVYVASKMKDILKNLYSVNLNLRHGSILSLGEIIHALSNIKDQHIEFGKYMNRSGDKMENVEIIVTVDIN